MPLFGGMPPRRGSARIITSPLVLTPGTHLGIYEVIAPIGAGGMGEVYRARDTRLKREVALKILPDSVAADPERLARFQREAEVLASLNHQHIAQIHGLEKSDGITALVMELVEGEDLAHRIAQGPIPIDDSLSIAKQIAEALEAAHDQGIIHRDLKPANIKVTPDGVVKVLDFGLAKLAQTHTAAVRADVTASPTITSPALMTGAGVILGTAAYMSPEQAKGREADTRSDIWAFGCVLYEMLSGRRAFKGDDVSDTLAAVLRGDPDWADLPAGTPPAISRLLRRCLAKDRARRLADIADARLELIDDVQEPKTPEQGSRGPLATLGWAAAALMAVVVVVALIRPREPDVPLHVTRFVITTPPTHDVYTGGGAQPALSPDGRTLVYVGLLADGGRRLFRRALDQLDALPIPGTEGIVVHPFFSPDGQSLGFMIDNGTIRRVRLSGGVAETVSDLAGRGAEWRNGGTIVFAGRLPGRGVIDSSLFQIPATGGTPTPIGSAEKPGGSDSQVVGRIYPKMLSSGDVLAFTLWTGSLDSARVGVRSLGTGEERVLMPGSSPQLLPTGHLLFARQNSIWATRFDAAQLQALGDPVRVIENVQVNAGGLALFAVSSTGTVAYVPGVAGAQRMLVWVDRQGREEPLTAAARRNYRSVRLSPDGLRVAVEVRGTDGKGDIYVWDGPRSSLVRFTSDSSDRHESSLDARRTETGVCVGPNGPDDGLFTGGRRHGSAGATPRRRRRRRAVCGDAR